MSDERKRRSRGLWIGWVLVGALVLYPLSMGPAYRWAWSNPRLFPERFRTFYKVYTPLLSLAVNFDWAGEAMHWYLNKFANP